MIHATLAAIKHLKENGPFWFDNNSWEKTDCTLLAGIEARTCNLIRHLSLSYDKKAPALLAKKEDPTIILPYIIQQADMYHMGLLEGTVLTAKMFHESNVPQTLSTLEPILLCTTYLNQISQLGKDPLMAALLNHLSTASSTAPSGSIFIPSLDWKTLKESITTSSGEASATGDSKK